MLIYDLTLIAVFDKFLLELWNFVDGEFLNIA